MSGSLDSCSLVAVRDKVVVSLVDTDKQKHGPSALIVTTAEHIDDVKRGRVVSVGSGFVTPDGGQIPLSLKVGDLILFPNNVGKTVWSFGNKYVVLREQEVLTIEQET